jgi:transposase
MIEALFTQALGLTSPWQVTSFDFSPDKGQVDFTVACPVQRLVCPACGAADQPIHDRLERTWQHLHFFQFKAFIHAALPRVVCSACGKTSQVTVPWSRGSHARVFLNSLLILIWQLHKKKIHNLFALSVIV